MAAKGTMPSVASPAANVTACCTTSEPSQVHLCVCASVCMCLCARSQTERAFIESSQVWAGRGEQLIPDQQMVHLIFIYKICQRQ